LLAGLVAAMLGLTQLAIEGLAPGGHLPLLALAAFAAGLLATFCTGHPSSAGGRTYPAARPTTPLPHEGQGSMAHQPQRRKPESKAPPRRPLGDVA
jgi:hypothetical protein